MSRFLVARRLVGAVLLVLLSARASSAQSSRKPRAFPALFGPTESEATRPIRLEVTCSVYDAADDNSFLTNDTDVLDPTLQSNRWYTGANVALAYTRKPHRNALSLNLASSARYYADLHQVVATRHSGAIGLDLYPAKDWRLQLSDSASYSPYYQVVFGPSAGALWGGDVPVSDDASVAVQHAMQYASFVGLSRNFGPQTALSLNYGVRYTEVFGGFDSNSQRTGFQFTHGLTKDIGVRIGYAYGVAVTGVDRSAAPIRNNDLDLGLNYGRTFSPSVRTSFSFATGSTIVSSGDGRHFRVTGSGRLTRRLTPTWTALATYDRGLSVPDGVTRPFFSDTIGGNIFGYVGRRVSLRLQPSYSHGVVGFERETNPYNSYSSTARAEIGLSRRLALYAEHFYYRYRFASQAGLPTLLIAGVDRQGARIGLTLWAPLVR